MCKQGDRSTLPFGQWHFLDGHLLQPSCSHKGLAPSGAQGAGEGLQEPPGSSAPGPPLLPHCAVLPGATHHVPEWNHCHSTVSEGDLHDIETKITETRKKGKEKAKGVKRETQ